MHLREMLKKRWRLVAMFTCPSRLIFVSCGHASKRLFPRPKADQMNSKSRNMDKTPSMATAPSSKRHAPLSYISNLVCSGCGKEYSHTELHTFCSFCQSPLLTVYNLNKAREAVDRDEISQRKKGMWRWAELLPVLQPENQIFLGEGDTSLLELPRLKKELGLTNL